MRAECPITQATGVEEPDHRHRRLLRACRERPRGRRAAEHTEKFAPPHVSTPGIVTAGL